MIVSDLLKKDTKRNTHYVETGDGVGPVPHALSSTHLRKRENEGYSNNQRTSVLNTICFSEN